MQLMRLRKTLQSWRSAFGHHCLQGLAHDKFTFHLCWHKVNSAERPTPMNSQPLEAECDTAGCLWGWQQQLPPLSRGSVGGASGVRAVCWQHRDAHSACHAAVRPPTLLPTPWSGRHKLSGDVNMYMLDRYRGLNTHVAYTSLGDHVSVPVMAQAAVCRRAGAVGDSRRGGRRWRPAHGPGVAVGRGRLADGRAAGQAPAAPAAGPAPAGVPVSPSGEDRAAAEILLAMRRGELRPSAERSSVVRVQDPTWARRCRC